MRGRCSVFSLCSSLSTALSYAVQAGYAAPTPVPRSASFPAVEPTKDTGNPDWFRDACSEPAQAQAGSGVQLVRSASGTPLAADGAYLGRLYTSSCGAHTGSSALSSGSCPFRLSSTPGAYDPRLFANNGSTVPASAVITTT